MKDLNTVQLVPSLLKTQNSGYPLTCAAEKQPIRVCVLASEKLPCNALLSIASVASGKTTIVGTSLHHKASPSSLSVSSTTSQFFSITLILANIISNISIHYSTHLILISITSNNSKNKGVELDRWILVNQDLLHFQRIQHVPFQLQGSDTIF